MKIKSIHRNKNEMIILVVDDKIINQKRFFGGKNSCIYM